MKEQPEDLLELLARQMDECGWGARADDLLTSAMVEKFAQCDLIVREVVRRLVDPERDYDDTGLYCVVMCGDETREESPEGEGRRLLAERFGAARNRDLEIQRDRAMQSLRVADEARRGSWNAQFKAEEASRNWKRRAETYGRILSLAWYGANVRAEIVDHAPECIPAEASPQETTRVAR